MSETEISSSPPLFFLSLMIFTFLDEDGAMESNSWATLSKKFDTTDS
ncbi:hypothetical protein HanPSC8_Chr14g0596241 [Helianthus annuus]|nr:hypothetical protein HanPSC8_Chr14g0596241 [Helianthus annuus]